jgi:cysteine synthase A
MTSFATLNDSWLSSAIARIEADFQRSADTHLIALPLPEFAARGIDLYLKDESPHPTSANFVGCLTLAYEMLARGEERSILSLLCDSGERYLPTYHDADWVAAKMGDCAAAQLQIGRLMRPGLVT